MKIIYTLGILLIFMSLISCTITPTSSENHYMSWHKRQKQLNGLTNWKLKSVVSIKESKQHTILHAYWQQLINEYMINITSQFNVGGIKIAGDANQVTLWRSNTNKVIAKNPENLIYNELGWTLPLSNLKYWILGLPAPNLNHNSKFDRYNHLTYLEQQNWRINYTNFISIKNIDLPTTILLSNNNLQIKIIIKQWDF